MDELDNQRNKKVVTVKIDGKIYTIKNPYNNGADDLQDKLAKQLYDVIRKDNKDVYEIAEKNTLKKENVQKYKDHIFENEHLLDQYKELGDLILILSRFKDGNDIEWLRHEFVEQCYESKNNAGYRDSHKY